MSAQRLAVDVKRVGVANRIALATLLSRYGIELRMTAPGELIAGSYWGESEAGLIGNRLFARHDTPLHSVLHEACHYVCMSPERRCGLDRDAGGDESEENAVCYLQVVLADQLAGYGRQRLFVDMDRWGYSFRLGSAQAWFESDASDAQRWLRDHALIDAGDALTWVLRS